MRAPRATWQESLAGDVDIQRIKFHYFEKYGYGMGMTADTLEEARRAATWMLILMWRRGLFEVQYAGMTREARAEAMAVRSTDGFAGGMPAGAQISSDEAFRRWHAGERGYALELRKEPLFVRLDATTMHYTTVELRTDDVLAVFAELGTELNLEPGASGLNSGRRNGVVLGTSKALDERGMTQLLAKKLMQHKQKSGVASIEVHYDDCTDTSDMGALLCGRRMMERKSNKGLLATICPELAEVRVFSDIATDDAVRVKLFEENAERMGLRDEVGALKEAVESGELSGAQLVEVESELECRGRELRSLENKLRDHTLKSKQDAVFEEARANLANVPLEELRARKRFAACTHSVAQVVAVCGNLADCTLLLPSRSRKREVVTPEQAAMLREGVPWAAVKLYEAEVRLVDATVRVSRGLVQVQLKPSAFAKACTLPEVREAERAAKRARKLEAFEQREHARAASEAQRDAEHEQIGVKRKALAAERAAKLARRSEPVRVRLHVSRCARRTGQVQLTLKVTK